MPIIASRASAAYGAGFGKSVATSGALEPFGAYESISTITLASNTASITFAGVPSGYKHLQIRANFAMAGGGIIKLNFNGDTSAYYKGHLAAGDGATAYGGVPSTSPNAICLGYTAGANSFGAVIVDILDYDNVAKYKVTRAMSGVERNGSGDVEFDSGLWMNTNPVSSITIAGQNANLTALSSFALYGVK